MKKGFTLIELLAVIVVLAVISVIAVPTLVGVVNKARINALKSSAYGLIEASNLYYAQYQNENNIRFDIEGSKVVSTDTTKMLKFKGNVKEGVSIIKGNGKTVVCVTDGKNSAYKNYNESQVSLVSGKCTIPDNSSIVYLDGEATIDSVDAKAILDRLDEFENALYPKIVKIYDNGVNIDEDQSFSLSPNYGGNTHGDAVVKNATNMRFTTSFVSGSHFAYGSLRLLYNFRPSYKKAKIYLSNASVNNSIGCYFGVFKGDSASFNANDALVYKEIPNGAESVEIDISNIYGKKYLAIKSGAGSGNAAVDITITKIELIR